MSYEGYSVVDCDGHIVESVAEMAEFMSERIRGHALKPSRNRQGVFPSLDGMHFALHEGKNTAKQRVTASEYRPGSGEDWLAFLEKAGILPFAYASDYPHEVDLPAAKHEIDEIAERNDLTGGEKRAVLGENAKRFFKL